MNNLFLCLLFIFVFGSVNAQDSAKEMDAFLTCIEQYYGSSNLLVKGPLYTQGNKSAFGSPYLIDRFVAGAVYINGQVYEKEYIKYNLARDILILEKNVKNGTATKLILDENTVDSFMIDQSLFVSKVLLYGSSEQEGYLQKVDATNPRFYFTQKKFFESIPTDKYPQGRYIDSATKVYYKKDNTIQEINNRREFLATFDSPKNRLKKYMRQHKMKFKKASKAQLIQLIKFIEDAS